MRVSGSVFTTLNLNNSSTSRWVTPSDGMGAGAKLLQAALFENREIAWRERKTGSEIGHEEGWSSLLRRYRQHLGEQRRHRDLYVESCNEWAWVNASQCTVHVQEPEMRETQIRKLFPTPFPVSISRRQMRPGSPSKYRTPCAWCPRQPRNCIDWRHPH